MHVKILALCGSSRRDSLNQKLLDAAVHGATDAGCSVARLRLRDLDLPIYDGDLEAEHGLPRGAVELKSLVAKHDGVLIATPEHNGGYTALLKNALDWCSRPSESDPTGLQCFAGKVAAVVSASPGLLGGMRSQLSLQISLNKLGVVVIPNSFALSMAHQAFDDTGRLKDAAAEKIVRGVGQALYELTRRLVARQKSDQYSGGEK
jgi:NAD(P)H-dependent FMN reductase